MKAGREEGALQNSVTGMQEYQKTIHGKWYLRHCFDAVEIW